MGSGVAEEDEDGGVCDEDRGEEEEEAVGRGQAEDACGAAAEG